jgi:zinc finger CCCH domain-containing protein 13
MKLEQIDVPISGSGHPGPYEQLSSGVAAAKGSRFAKFFDGKGRDSHPGMGKAQVGGPSPAQRGDLGGYNGMPTNPDARAMEDIFAMLSNSAHVGCTIVYIEIYVADISVRLKGLMYHQKC